MENLKALPTRITSDGNVLRDELKQAKQLENILDMRVAFDKAIERVESMLDLARTAAADVEEYADGI
jgi:hypothetical protein